MSIFESCLKSVSKLFGTYFLRVVDPMCIELYVTKNTIDTRPCPPPLRSRRAAAGSRRAAAATSSTVPSGVLICACARQTNSIVGGGEAREFGHWSFSHVFSRLRVHADSTRDRHLRCMLFYVHVSRRPGTPSAAVPGTERHRPPRRVSMTTGTARCRRHLSNACIPYAFLVPASHPPISHSRVAVATCSSQLALNIRPGPPDRRRRRRLRASPCRHAAILSQPSPTAITRTGAPRASA